jgi:hypothetical protein
MEMVLYINLPIGAVSVAIVVFILHLPKLELAKLAVSEKPSKIDPLGSFFFITSIFCLLLAL